MHQIIREFRVGRPQIFAGLMLLVFFAQCLWVARGRKLSELEYQYIASGFSPPPGQAYGGASPFTGWIASLPLRTIAAVRAYGPSSWSSALAIPRPWLVRLPFMVFGIWLGGALWWVARRLFDDEGGYVALALYCSSPAMVKISSNIGPEIILAWGGIGLVYTAIGVAHTLYAPPRKWVPRIGILGLSIGFALSTAVWSFTLVLLAFAFMIYLAPGRRRSIFIVLGSASAIGLAVLGVVTWLTGATLLGPHSLFRPQLTFELVRSLWFVFSDGYALGAFFIAALTGYGSWARARYFGNSAPLITAFAAVLLFALVPAIHVWDATLGLSFMFIFIGGIAADFLETRFRRAVAVILLAGLVFRIVQAVMDLSRWIHQIQV
jgi:hypothetical protein